MALPKVKEDVTTRVLAALPNASLGAWATAARDAARGRIATVGLPVPREEYWKFTKPTVWTDETPRFSGQGSVSDVFGAVKPLTLVFVDGAFDAAASDDLSLEGVEIELLSKAASVDVHWAKSLYGVLEANANDATAKDGAALFKPVPRAFAALNSATLGEGVILHVTGAVERPIRLSYQFTGNADVVLHHLVKVDAGATVTLLEEGAAGPRANTMIEADVADTGAFHHVRIQGPDVQADEMAQLYARLGTESIVKSFTLSLGGEMTRNEAIIELTGDDASAHVAGAAMGEGAFHHDDTVYVTHDAVNCESRQVFKKVLRDGAVGVFQGKILVQPEAQKTDGYQISQSLLLDDDSQFLAKPELEIYADDVACSHGSTSGAIDETALFYLQSRGVPKTKATDLLTLAFLAEAVDEVEAEELRDAIVALLEAWMEHRGS